SAGSGSVQRSTSNVQHSTLKPLRRAKRRAGCDVGDTLRIAKRLQARALRLEHSGPDVKVALWERNFDAGYAEFFLDCEIQIALEAAWSMTHLTAPDDELKIDGTLAKVVQEYARGRIPQDVRIAPAGGD